MDDLTKDKSLNHSGDTAMYATTAMIPNKIFLNDFMTDALAAMVDTHE